MKTLSVTFPAVLVAGALIVLACVALFPSTQKVEGSTARGSEYQGTTTSTGNTGTESLLMNTGGTFGSVVLMAPTTGTMYLYDATTSDITKRAATMATATQLVASFPSNAATSTYTFDRNVYSGLYLVVTGTVPTSTITFRP